MAQIGEDLANCLNEAKWIWALCLIGQTMSEAAFIHHFISNKHDNRIIWISIVFPAVLNLFLGLWPVIDSSEIKTRANRDLVAYFSKFSPRDLKYFYQIPTKIPKSTTKCQRYQYEHFFCQ